MTRETLLAICLLALSPALSAQTPTPAESTLLELAETATEAAVRIRGLPPLHPVTSRVTTRQEVENYVVTRLDTTGMNQQLDVTAGMLIHFGALPPGTDLPSTTRRILREQVAGYYDWLEKTLFIADWLPQMLQLPTLIHEVTHALQDQHHDLGRFMAPNPGFSEASTAVAALIEGDATLVMMGEAIPDWDPGASALKRIGHRSQVTLLARIMRQQVAEEPSLKSVPPVLRNLLVFPYVEGMNLAGIVHAEGGWKAIDALYDDPPISTEQVLHLDKLLKTPRDNPLELHVPTRLSDSAQRLGSDSLGELGLREILATQLPRDQASQAAAGWGGDRYVLMGRKNRTLTQAQRWATQQWAGPNAAGIVAGMEPSALCWVAEMDSPEEGAELESALQGLRRPPEHLRRMGTRLIAGWGHPAVLDAEKCDRLLTETRTERVTHYRWYAERAEAPPRDKR